METVIKIFENFTPFTTPTLQIKIDAKPDQKFYKTKVGGKRKRKLAVFKGEDSISGIIEVTVKPDTEFQHFGIKIMLIGLLEIYGDNSLTTEFCSLTKELTPAGTVKAKTILKFKFQNFDKDYSTFYGVCGEVRYFLKATMILDKYIPNINKEVPFAVFKYENPQKYQITQPIKIGVGSDKKLNLQLEINKNSFHLKDCIQGFVQFTELIIQINYMELWIVRKQKLGSENFVQNDTQIMIKYQLMDGSPEVGKIIPIRLYLNGIAGLSPSFSSLHDRLSISYSLKLMIVDYLGKKYFKEAPITLYRYLKQST